MNRFIIIAITASLTFLSCSKVPATPPPVDKATISISIISESTKSDDISTTAGEEAITSLEVLVFRADEGPDNGILDTRKNATASEIAANALTLEATPGRRNIYVFANAPGLNNIANESDLRSYVSSMSDNSRDSFVMIGTPGATSSISAGNTTNNINVALHRLACRIKVENIRTDFPSDALRNAAFSLKSIYLANVPATFTPINGDVSDIFSTIPAPTAYMAATNDLTALSYTGRTLSDNPFSADIYLYSYPNSDTVRTTKVVIETEMNGVTYYYPIEITGTRPNTAYTINNVVITRLGSTDPDTPVTISGCSFNVEVQPWQKGIINGNGNDFTI